MVGSEGLEGLEEMVESEVVQVAQVGVLAVLGNHRGYCTSCSNRWRRDRLFRMQGIPHKSSCRPICYSNS